MSNLAVTLQALGELDSARDLQIEVLTIRREILGNHHEDTLTAMSNLAVTLDAFGDLDSVRHLESEVLTIRREIQGDRHPDTLTATNDLAVTLQALGKLDSSSRTARRGNYSDYARSTDAVTPPRSRR